MGLLEEALLLLLQLLGLHRGCAARLSLLQQLLVLQLVAGWCSSWWVC
jgi:hypothetical protein